ncbi:MAG: DUF4124 domain-containing protein [Gammaproteobacteria bacterium]
MAHRIALTASLALLALTVAPAGADIYKCVDEDGNVNYVQSPLPNCTKRVRGAPAQPADAEATKEKLETQLKEFDERRELEQASEEEIALRAQDKKVREMNCKRASANLQALMSRGQISVKEGEEYRKLPEEERQAKIEESKGHIEEFCGG